MLCAVEGEVVKKDTLITGLALFAMFFGAGNLIFPPYLGMESGTEWVLGFLCFVLIDVVLSCLGIFALNAAGGANAAVEGSIGRVPGLVLNTAVILCTGMVIAEPRTAATTYEMSIVPLFGDGVGILAFSAVFFAVVLALSIRQTHVVTVIGKVLTPLLVACVAVLIVVGVAHPLGDIGAPLSTTVAQDGISAGYQAMDVLACVGFAIVMENAARTAGYTRREDQLKVIAGASVVAGLLLAVIYGGLTFLGAASATSFGAGMDRSTLIVAIVQHLLGDTGMAVLAVIVGMFQGGVQALSRSHFAKIIPPEKSGEYFGLFDICGKGASFLGTMIVSVGSQLTGSANVGVGSIAILFVIGFVLFSISTRTEETKRV